MREDGGPNLRLNLSVPERLKDTLPDSFYSVQVYTWPFYFLSPPLRA